MGVDAIGGAGIELEPLPPWLQRICDELTRCGIFPPDAPPNHVLLNEYQIGQGIAAHKDGPLYAPRVAILSLGSHATFEFSTPSTPSAPSETVASMLLPPRGVFVFGGDAYKSHLHGIKGKAADDTASPGLVCLDRQAAADGADEHGLLPRRRRLSLTVRRVRRWYDRD